MFQVQTPCGITMANTVRKGRLCLLAHNLTLTLAYGVDWEALSDSRVMRHHAANNPRAGEPTALEARTHERPRELSIVRLADENNRAHSISEYSLCGVVEPHRRMYFDTRVRSMDGM